MGRYWNRGYPPSRRVQGLAFGLLFGIGMAALWVIQTGEGLVAGLLMGVVPGVIGAVLWTLFTPFSTEHETDSPEGDEEE